MTLDPPEGEPRPPGLAADGCGQAEVVRSFPGTVSRRDWEFIVVRVSLFFLHHDGRRVRAAGLPHPAEVVGEGGVHGFGGRLSVTGFIGFRSGGARVTSNAVGESSAPIAGHDGTLVHTRYGSCIE